MENINLAGQVDPLDLGAALEQVRPELAQYTAEKLHTINLDPVAIATTVWGALPGIIALRPEIVSGVPTFDIKILDKLETYASALVHANALHVTATLPPEVIASLAEEALQLRDVLISDVTALGKHGLINATFLHQLKGPQGYRNIAGDVVSIVTVIQTNWAKVSSRIGITEEELKHAKNVALKLMRAIGAREQAPSVTASVALERQQAYSLFIDAYDEVRRAVAFLRWNEGDADKITPSLYGGRSSKKKTDTEETSTANDPTPETTSTTAPVTTPAVTTAPAARVAVGLPNADPFAS
jgi:hypothetical protein